MSDSRQTILGFIATLTDLAESKAAHEKVSEAVKSGELADGIAGALARQGLISGGSDEEEAARCILAYLHHWWPLNACA